MSPGRRKRFHLRHAGPFLRNDDAWLFAGEFRRGGITAAHELEDCARFRAAVGLVCSETQQQHEYVENLRIFCRRKTRALRSPLFYLGKKPGQIIIKRARQLRFRRPFEIDAAGQGARGFGERVQRLQHLGVGQIRMRAGELENSEDESGKDVFMFVDDFRPEVFVRKWNTGTIRGLAVLFFVMMRRNQIRTISGTINGDFALGAAANRADSFPLCRAVALRFSLRADGTTHQFSLCATRASVRKPSSGARWSGRLNDASSWLPNAERTGARESPAGRGSGPAEPVLPAPRPSL